jgi:hypothetical protein
VGKGAEKGVGLPTARFFAGVGAEERPAAVFVDARRQPPQGARLRQGGGVGDSPRGPLKQRGNPHLKPTTKPKHAKPNHAGA